MMKNALRRIGACAGLAWLTVSALAQHQQESPGRVLPVFVDALVLDSELRLVSGLRANEFVIYEDEVPHQVSLLEAAGPSAERSGRVHPMVLVLVGETAQAFGPDRATAVARALRLRMGSADQVCIFRLGEDLRLVHPFSSQAEELVAALQSSEPGQLLQADSLPPSAAPDRDPFASAESRRWLARQIQRLFYATPIELRRTAESSYPALVQAAARALSGLQGRKTLLLLGSGLSSPALPSSEIERTVELANAFHLAVYSQDEVSPTPPPGAGVRQSVPIRSGNRASPLRLTVNSSGGFVLQQDDLASQLERVFQEAHQHYRLFYRSRKQNAAGRYRQLRLLVKRVGLEARFRTGYPARPPGLELLNHSEIEALETIRQAEQSKPLSAFLRVDVLPDQSVGQKTLVSLGIPADSLQFHDLSEQGRRGRFCRLQTVALLRDESGAVLQTFGGPLALNLDASRFQIVEQDGLAVTRLLDLAPGKYLLETGVLDELSGGGAWLRHEFRVEPADEKFALGPILLGRRDRLAVRGRDAAQMGIGNFVPSARRTFQPAGSLSFVVEARNLSDGEQPELQAYLENALGARSALNLEIVPGRAHLAQGQLDLSKLAPGNYHVVVEASDSSSGARAQSRIPFAVVK